MTRIILLAIAALLTSSQAFQESAERCDNFKASKHKCTCQKATKCEEERDSEEDRSCKHWSKPDLCKCISPCET